MNEDLTKRVMAVIDDLRGSSKDIMSAFDEAIEDGEISQEEFHQYETSILCLVDNQIFTCVRCGWTLNVDEMGEDTEGGEIQCSNCASDEYGDEDD
ncbi:MAG: hypothetical protein EOO61_03405 [Hymenobacter sp.]|nr:MAG: hypothetical protein EOO61_03405 [Hymenobacter sp.]